MQDLDDSFCCWIEQTDQLTVQLPQILSHCDSSMRLEKSWKRESVGKCDDSNPAFLCYTSVPAADYSSLSHVGHNEGPWKGINGPKQAAHVWFIRINASANYYSYHLVPLLLA